MMKRLNAIVLLLVLAVVAGCGGSDDDTDNPNPNNPAANTPKCLVTKWDYGNDANVYDYDAKKRLIKVTDTQFNNPQSTVHFEYNADGKISKTTRSDQNGIFEYTDWEYNAAGLRSKENLFSQNGAPGSPLTLETSITNEYDATNKLIKRSVFIPANPNAPMLYFTYTYPTPDRVIMERYQVMGSTPNFAGSTEYFHDNQKKPLRFGGVYDSNELLSPHNIIKEKFTYPDGRIDSIVYTLQYNSDGYPVQKLVSHNGGPAATETITYNCQ